MIAVNTSYEKVLWADVLMFTDHRWWRMHENRVRETFDGQIVTITPKQRDYGGLLVLQRQRSSGVSTDPTRLACWHTTMTAVLNMAVLRGAKCIGVLGLDGKGDWHHEPHPERWGRYPLRHEKHGKALALIAEPLAAMGTHVLNLNPDSAHRMFEFSTLDQLL